MLGRAFLLRSVIDLWIQQESQVNQKFKRLMVTSDEWTHVNYMVSLLYPFKRWTTALSKTSGVIIHQAWTVYNTLFDHLDDHYQSLSLRVASASVYKRAIDAGRDKLSQYYSKTNDDPQSVYNLACILDPSTKLNLYRTEDWLTYLPRYKSQFEDYYNSNYKPNPALPQSNTVQLAPLDDFNTMALQSRRKTGLPTVSTDEITAYLSSPVLAAPIRPLIAWSQIQSEYPNLARMAQDIYSVALAEVEAERVFSIARRVCRYDRAQLDPATIQMIMVVKMFDPDLIREDLTTFKVDEEGFSSAEETALALDLSIVSLRKETTIQTTKASQRKGKMRTMPLTRQDQASDDEVAARI
jgi:hAT family C-terminal dimerisation region